MAVKADDADGCWHKAEAGHESHRQIHHGYHLEDSLHGDIDDGDLDKDEVDAWDRLDGSLLWNHNTHNRSCSDEGCSHVHHG